MKKGDLLKAKIVDKSLKLFAKKGFHLVSFQLIADKLGVSQSAVINHFPDKTALNLGIIQKVLVENAQFVESLDGVGDDSIARLHNYVVGNYRWAMEEKEQLQILLSLIHLAGVHESYHSLYQQLKTGAESKILERLYSCFYEKRIKYQKKYLEGLAQTMHNHLIGHIISLHYSDVINDDPEVLAKDFFKLFDIKS